MTKQDLKDGMILETRNGERYLLLNGRMFNVDGHIGLVDYSEDLKCVYNEDNDIIKVYEDSKAYYLTDIFKDEYLELLWERKEMELTDIEIEILKSLQTSGYEWLARDRDGELFAFIMKPKRRYEIWVSDLDWNTLIITRDNTQFTFIKWEDDEPTKIDDLLKGV